MTLTRRRKLKRCRQEEEEESHKYKRTLRYKRSEEEEEEEKKPQTHKSTQGRRSRSNSMVIPHENEFKICGHFQCIRRVKVAPVLSRPLKWSCQVCNTTQEVFICLTCGHRGCSRSVSRHGFQHFEQNPTHALAMQVPDAIVYCYRDEEWVLPDADNNRNDLTLLRQTVYILAKGAVPGMMTRRGTQFSSDKNLSICQPSLARLPSWEENEQRGYASPQARQGVLPGLSVADLDEEVKSDRLATADQWCIHRTLARAFLAWHGYAKERHLHNRQSEDPSSSVLNLVLTHQKYDLPEPDYKRFYLYREDAKNLDLSISATVLNLQKIPEILPYNESKKYGDYYPENQINGHMSMSAQLARRSKLPKGRTGLRNLGNTCFINSTLQCLLHTRMWRSHFLKLKQFTYPGSALFPTSPSLIDTNENSIDDATGLDLGNDSCSESAASSQAAPAPLLWRQDTSSVYSYMENPKKNQGTTTSMPIPDMNTDAVPDGTIHSVATRSPSLGPRLTLTPASNVPYQSSDVTSTVDNFQLESSPKASSSIGMSRQLSFRKETEQDKLGSSMVKGFTFYSQANTLCVEMSNIARLLWSGRWAVITPYAFIATVWRILPRFKGYNQQDAQEFYSALVDNMHEEAMRGGIPEDIYEEFLRDSDTGREVSQGLESRRNTTVCSLAAYASRSRDKERSRKNKNSRKDEVPISQRCKGPLFYRYQPSDHIANTVCGTIINRIHCCQCGSDSTREEPFSSISIDLNSPEIKDMRDCSLDDCLTDMVQPEILGGENSYYCSQCDDYVTAYKQRLLNRLPYVIVVHVNRAQWTLRGAKSKLDKFISYPLEEFRPYSYLYESEKLPIGTPDSRNNRNGGTTGNSKRMGAKRNASSGKKSELPYSKPIRWTPTESEEFRDIPGYKLAGLVEHSGRGIDRGHYVAFCRDPFPRDDIWHRYNDHYVTLASTEQVAHTQAYLLFYERLDSRNNKAGG